MAQEKDFKIISVDASEDQDEVVIQAGAVPARSNAPQAAEAAQPAAADAAPVSQGPADAIPEQDEADAPDAAAHADRPLTEAEQLIADGEVDEEALAEYAAHKRRSQAREQDNAMLTTQDDLHAKAPFSGMQRAIVIILAVLVVAMVVYWFASQGA